MSCRALVLFTTLVVLIMASAPHGQQPLGAPVATSVAGSIRDESGAVVPKVQVSLTQEDAPNAQPRTTVTGEDGSFRFVGIPAGTYRLEASFPGFSRIVRTGIPVQLSQATTIALVLRRPGAGAGAGATGPPPPPPSAPAPPPPSAPAPTPPPATEPTMPPATEPTMPPASASAPPPASAPAPPPDQTGEGLAVVPVFYATDRARTNAVTLDYGSVRNPSGTISMGRYDVSIPRDAHEMGSTERPTIWTLFQEDPSKHFVIVSRRQQSYEAFYTDLRGVVARSTRKDAFVFIHGFNVAFEDAVFRTAQIAYDLKFDGAPILYSWPSNTGENPIGYTAAQNNNDWTVAHLDYFLRDVTAKTGATRIHLIAHSMGNRAMVNALNRWPLSATKKFNQILLTAPDMDAQTFVQLADAVTRNSERATLYASASDRALILSKQLNAYPRAGDTGPGVVVVPGIDTVDVTAVDSDFVGHFYYGDNRSVISDIFLLLTQGLPPMSRPELRREGLPPKQFWRFVR